MVVEFGGGGGLHRFILVHIQEECSAFSKGSKRGEQVLVGDYGAGSAIGHTVQRELSEVKARAELGLQLGERGGVAFDTSTVAGGPILHSGELAVVGGLDSVGGEGGHGVWRGWVRCVVLCCVVFCCVVFG